MTHHILTQTGITGAPGRLAAPLFIGTLALIVALSLARGGEYARGPDRVDALSRHATSVAADHGIASRIVKQPQRFPDQS